LKGRIQSACKKGIKMQQFVYHIRVTMKNNT
jgi:hypothetical protein